MCVCVVRFLFVVVVVDPSIKLAAATSSPSSHGPLARERIGWVAWCKGVALRTNNKQALQIMVGWPNHRVSLVEVWAAVVQEKAASKCSRPTASKLATDSREKEGRSPMGMTQLNIFPSCD